MTLHSKHGDQILLKKWQKHDFSENESPDIRKLNFDIGTPPLEIVFIYVSYLIDSVGILYAHILKDVGHIWFLSLIMTKIKVKVDVPTSVNISTTNDSNIIYSISNYIYTSMCIEWYHLYVIWMVPTEVMTVPTWYVSTMIFYVKLHMAPNVNLYASNTIISYIISHTHLLYIYYLGFESYDNPIIHYDTVRTGSWCDRSKIVIY